MIKEPYLEISADVSFVKRERVIYQREQDWFSIPIPIRRLDKSRFICALDETRGDGNLITLSSDGF